MMKKILLLPTVLLVIFMVAIVIWSLFARGNSAALWQIINLQCLPNQQQNGTPAPCLKVDLSERYLLFKDQKGPYHYLIMPTDKISGIESPVLQTTPVRPYISQAWNNRAQLSNDIGKPLNDEWIALAVNSKYGRSQHQLHIHLACLHPDVYQVLHEQVQHIDQQWRPLTEKLMGHHYLGKKLAGADLAKEDPFQLLQTYAVTQGDDISNYGLAVITTPQGEMVMLANRLRLTQLNLNN